MPPSVDVELDRLDARRRQLLGVGLLAAVGAAGIATLALTYDAVQLPAWVPVVLFVVTALFVVEAMVQDRTLARLTRTVTAQQARGDELAATVADLTALHATARRVNAVLLPEEVYDVVLDAAVDLLDASHGALRLRVEDRLVVAASAGPGAPERGAVAALEDDPSRAVLTDGAVLREVGPPRLAVPITVGERHVGVLEVARDAGDDPFGERLALVARLFAEEAATAFVNANRYDLERSRVEAMTLDRVARSDAVADTVHDLRAPLAGLVGFAGLLRDRYDRLDDDRRREAVEAVHQQAELLGGLIDDVFDVASAEARATTAREPVDVTAVVEAAVGTVRGGTGDRVTIEVLAAGPSHALGDRDALQRVVTNLVANAAEHGGDHVQVRVGTRSGEVWVHVADRGPGLAEAEAVAVFRGRSHRSRDGNPRGRGLAIVDTLVRAMDGRVLVRSQPGVGTVFTVRLPAA